MSAATAKDWFSIKEACEYLGISEPTLFRWMKAGKVSYYKVGNGTRFKKGNLDMVAEKKVSETEGELASQKCAVCGNAGLVEGRIQGTGRTYFRPSKPKFLTLTEPMIAVDASMCPVCGYVQLRGDTAKLGKVMPAPEEE